MKNWIIGVILVLAAVAAYYFFNVYQTVEPEPIATAPVAVVEPVIEPEKPEETESATQSVTEFLPAAEAEIEEIPLPMLTESDPVVLESLEGMVGEPAVRQYVVGDNVISRVVATIDMLGSRQVPAVVQAVSGPASNFEVVENDNPETIITNEEGDPIPQFIIDPANYARYTPYVELLEAADTAELIDNYRSMYPLFQEAYRQMGYADADFNNRLVEIIDDLLATPEITGPINLVKPEAFYLFTDPDLESRSAGQKILLRMGNENAARVKAKLAEIKAGL